MFTTIKIDFNRNPSVSNLFGISGPSNITGLIPKVIVYSLKGLMRFGLPYIIEKGFKVILPIGVHSNSASTIIHKTWVFFIEAPLLHIFPNPMDAGSCKSMPLVRLAGSDFLVTPTRYRSSRAYISTHRYNFFSAVTHALPVPLTTFIASMGKFYKSESTEFGSRRNLAYIFHHNDYSVT